MSEKAPKMLTAKEIAVLLKNTGTPGVTMETESTPAAEHDESNVYHQEPDPSQNDGYAAWLHGWAHEVHDEWDDKD